MLSSCLFFIPKAGKKHGGGGDMSRFIFVTGGVVSGLGKGITAASLGRLLKARGLRVAAQKLDPYIKADTGITPSMSLTTISTGSCSMRPGSRRPTGWSGACAIRWIGCDII